MIKRGEILMGKVYGYCRTARQGSMEEQIELISNYCKDKGLDLEVCFCDDGMSAHEVHKEELDKLLNIIESGDTIVTKDYSRFMRNPIMQQVFVNDLNSRGIDVVYTDQEEKGDDGIGIEAWIKER